MAKKSTKKEIFMRGVAIKDMIAKGYSEQEIFDEISHTHKTSIRTVKTQYHKILDEIIEKSDKENLPQLKASLMARNDLIFQQAIKGNNLKTALDAIDKQAKLAGLYLPTQETVVNKTPEMITIREADNSIPLSVVADKKAGNE